MTEVETLTIRVDDAMLRDAVAGVIQTVDYDLWKDLFTREAYGDEVADRLEADGEDSEGLIAILVDFLLGRLRQAAIYPQPKDAED